MNKVLVHIFAINAIALFALPIKSYAAVHAGDTAVQKINPAHSQFPKQAKRHVSINGQKFELIAKHLDHWLLYDLQLRQYCITLNQLVVVTSDLPPLLQQVGWPYKEVEWELLAKNTYRWTGTFSRLPELHQKLKKAPDTQLEWQLQYLPQSRQAEM